MSEVVARSVGRRFRSCLCTVVFCALTGTAIGQEAIRDEFNDPQLDPAWTVVHEDASNYTLSARPGFFRVITQRGTFSPDSFVRNMLLRQVRGDFILQTRLEFDPRSGQPFAGLLVYESDDNAAAFGLTFVSGIRGEFRGLALVTVARVAAGQRPPVSRFDETTTDSPSAVYLRLLRSGDQLVAGFSDDGQSFTDLATVSNKFPETVMVGIGGSSGDTVLCGAACDNSLNADFDFFSLTPLDAAGGDTGSTTDVVVLSSIAISGPTTVFSGKTSRFTATATFSDESTLDVTDLANWSVAPPGLATVNRGLVDVAVVGEPSRLTIVAEYTQLSSSGATTSDSDAVVVDVSTASPPLCGAGLAALLWVGFIPLVLRFRKAHRRRGS